MGAARSMGVGICWGRRAGWLGNGRVRRRSGSSGALLHGLPSKQRSRLQSVDSRDRWADVRTRCNDAHGISYG